MPAAPRVIPQTVDVAFRWLGPQGQECENVYQFKYDGPPPTVGPLTTLAAQVAARLAPKYAPLMTNKHRFVEVHAKDLSASTGTAQGVYTFPNGSVGNQTADPLPSNVGCNVVLRGIVTGGTHTGAKRISGFDEGTVTQDTLANALISALLDLAIQWLTAYVAGGITFEPAVGSLKGGYSTVIQSIAIMNPYVDSNKTRLIPHGQ